MSGDHSPGETCAEADERFADCWIENEHLRAVVARVRALADKWQGNVDAAAITYQDAEARRRATGWLQNVATDLRAALDPEAGR